MAGRIALVDDHDLFRHALGDLLCARGFAVVAQAPDARSSFALIDRARPDLVLLDVEMPGMDGVTAARELLARPSEPKVMIVSAFGAPYQVAEAWAAGVHGYALKSIPVAGLVHAIRTVIRGDRYLGPGLTTNDAGVGDPLAALSARERDVFRMLVRGLTSRQMAAQLCISPKTVETHRERILRKLGVHSVVQLVRFAATHDLLLE